MDKDDGLLLDMLIAARMLRDFTAGVSWEEFSRDGLLESAVRYQEQVLGEAAGQLTPDFRRRHREIPWEKLIGMRHRLVHGYRDLEARRIWRIVETEIPRIISALEKLVPPEDVQSE